MPEVPIGTPGTSPNELAVNRVNTAAFIAARPTFVDLVPRKRQQSGSGVTWVYDEPRATQIARLVDISAVGGLTSGRQQTVDGSQESQTFQLILPYDGEVAVDDYWIDENGRRHEVREVLPDNGYEVRATVVRYG